MLHQAEIRCIFLKKRNQPLLAEGQLELGQEISETDEGYQVYMARLEDIGYDATGRAKVSEADTHEPPEVKATIIDFATRLGW